MTSRERIKEIVEYYEEEIRRAEIKKRKIMQAIKKTLDMEEITAIAGVRRAGKTYLMYWIAKTYEGTYLNFEDERLSDFKVEDFEKLFSVVLEKKNKILLLDEVQNVKTWEKFAARIQKRMKIFVSGSNSSFLSSEFSSILTGRTITLNVSPLSFQEYLDFKNIKNRNKEMLRAETEKYINIGGFPRIVLTENKKLIHEYFNRIIYRDIIPRFSIKKPNAIYRLAVYLLSNLGKKFSYRKLKAVCELKHETTIKDYVSYLEKAFLINVVKKYDHSLKKQEIMPKKVYAVDTAFSDIGKTHKMDRTRFLENLIYNELKKRYPYADISYEEKKKEVDFILAENFKPIAGINVAYEITDEKTFEREMAGLMELKKGIKKVLITLYTPKFEIPNGIKYLNAVDFLLGKNIY